MNAEQVKEFYNSNFFKNGQPVSAQILVTFAAGEQLVTVPGIKVSASATIESIFKAYYDFLAENNGLIEEEKQETESSKVLDIVVINYRSNTYLLDVLEGDQYIVRRKEDGVLIDSKTPLARGVVKQYKAM